MSLGPEVPTRSSLGRFLLPNALFFWIVSEDTRKMPAAHKQTWTVRRYVDVTTVMASF